VKSLSKAILITFAVLAGIALLLVLALNLYVQSPGTQARIQEELSQALKLPLVITNTTLTPWSDLHINGIAVPGEKGNFLEASSFSARYRLLPILRKRLVIYDMRFESPKIVWMQNEKGKWELPALAKAPKEATEAPSEKKETKKKPGKDDFQVVLDRFKITGGSAEFLDKEGKRVALFTDVEMDYTSIAEERLEGVARIGRINYADTLFFDNVRTPFKYVGGQFSLPAIEATLAGGPVTASFELQAEKSKSPFVTQLQFEDADLARLSTEAGWASGRATGTLRGTFEMAGVSGAIDKAKGKGELVLTNGTLRQMDLLQTLGEVLQFEELIQLRVNSGVANFRFENEKVQVDHIALQSPDLKLTAQGMARFNRKLDLDARLSVDERTLKRRAPFVRQLFAAADDNGEHAIDFKIMGTIDKPKTDLAEKLLGKSLGDQFENVVSRLFGFGRKKDEEKKKDEKKKKKKDEPGAGGKPPVSPAQGDLPLPSPGGRPIPATPSSSAGERTVIGVP
jgi:type II secretion system protein N